VPALPQPITLDKVNPAVENASRDCNRWFRSLMISEQKEQYSSRTNLKIKIAKITTVKVDENLVFAQPDNTLFKFYKCDNNTVQFILITID